jgi:hypothetical protein
MEPSEDDIEDAGAPAPPTRRESLVPALAVTAVAVVAVAAAVMVKRADNGMPREAALDPARSSSAIATAQTGEVVTAPPLKPSATQAMGGAAACKNCGVVEMVVAVNDPARKEPRGYQMHIRMDDGTRRTIEQRGALAAGSRVMVEGSVVKPIS